MAKVDGTVLLQASENQVRLTFTFETEEIAATVAIELQKQLRQNKIEIELGERKMDS